MFSVYSLLERPSLTRYARSLNASSTAGLEGKCDRVFGCAGTICIFVDTDDPLVPTKFFLSSRDKSFSFIAPSAISSCNFFPLCVQSCAEIKVKTVFDSTNWCTTIFLCSFALRTIYFFKFSLFQLLIRSEKELKIINRRNQNRKPIFLFHWHISRERMN